MAAMSALHNRAADSLSVSSTFCRSNVERLITFSTSALAVCCRKDSPGSSVRSCNSLKQPRILDGNNRLLGEVAEQLDLLVGERADLLSINHDRADQFGVPKHRYSDKRPSACEIR